MAARQLPLPGEIVKKSNALCRASWSQESIWEARLVALVASKIRTDDKDFQIYTIPAKEILPDRNKLGNWDRNELHKAVTKAMSRVITINDPDGWTSYNLFSRCRYNRKEDVLELRFDPDLKPHYLDLKKRFAEYNLFEFLKLPSTYSQRIFEILKSYSDLPEITISLIDLHKMLDTPESFQKDFRNFRIKVLEKTSKDIKKHTSLEFEWEPLASGNRLVKRGMTTVAIRFTFSKKRVDEAAAKKKAEDNTKEKKKNNELFQNVMKCYGHKGRDCKEDLGKEECEFCKSVNAKQTRIE